MDGQGKGQGETKMSWAGVGGCYGQLIWRVWEMGDKVSREILEE